ncbi:MAG: hypothetical protein WBA28_04890 [Microbacteriaceae bacterium]
MTAEFLNIVLFGGAAIIGAIGGWLSTLLTMRGKAKDQQLLLINELQEERNTWKEALDKERAMYSSKLDRMWADKSASRDHVAALRDHIWQRKPPPPPVAPDHYIH